MKTIRKGLIVLVLMIVGLLMVASNGCPGKSDDTKAGSSTSTPTVPSELTLTVSSSEITLSWLNNPNDALSFNIERKSVTDGIWQIIGVADRNTLTYSDTNAYSWIVYYYRVQSFTNSGESGYSNEVCSTPSAPSGLTLSIVSPSQINLSWTDTAGSESGFKIERKISSGGTYSLLETVGTNVTSYSDTTVSSGNSYYYRVKAYNAVRESNYSNEVTTNILTPSSLSLAITTTPITTITLSWSNVSNETGYQIQRKTGSGGTYAEIATTDVNVTTLSDSTSIAYGSDYYYRVKAYSGMSESSWRESSTALADPALAASSISSTLVSLSWTDLSNETGYQLERDDGGGWSAISNAMTANVTTYNDNTVISNTNYSYQLRGFHLLNTGSWSYLNTPTPLSAPAALDSAVVSTTMVSITWTAVANADAYIIERKEGTGEWTTIESAWPSGDTDYDDIYDFLPDTTYYYRVRGYDDVTGNGEASPETSQTPVN